MRISHPSFVRNQLIGEDALNNTKGITGTSSSSLRRRSELDDVLERQPERLADRANRAEGRPPAAGEQVAQGAFVHVGLLSQVATRPTAQDPRSIDGVCLNAPFQSGHGDSHRDRLRSRLARTRSRKSRPVTSMYSASRRRETAIVTSRSLTPAIAASELA